MPTPPIVQVISHLSDLGNLAGAALGTNIGYLSLERFRYREQLRKCAVEQLAPIAEESKLLDSIKNSVQYKDLVYVAKLTNHDGVDEAKNRIPVKGHAPSGGWSVWYRILFSRQQDQAIAGLIVGVALFILLCGIATAIGIWSVFTALGYEPWLEIEFWFLTIGLFAPGLFVLIGRWVVMRGRAHSIEAGKQLADLIKDMVQKAKPPGDGPGGGGSGGAPPTPVPPSGPGIGSLVIRRPPPPPAVQTAVDWTQTLAAIDALSKVFGPPKKDEPKK